jgi:hypothetical protein
MSKRSPHAAVRNVLMSLTILGTLPAMAASGLDGPAGQAKTPAPPAVQLRPSRPARPAVRTPASFTPQMPLSEAIDILRNCTSPPLNIVVLWKDLDSAGIYRDTPIGIDGIPGLRLGRYLELLVLSLSAGATTPIGYTVQNGVVIISTTAALPAPRYVTRVYDISDLTAPPANYFFPPMGFGNMGYGGMGPGHVRRTDDGSRRIWRRLRAGSWHGPLLCARRALWSRQCRRPPRPHRQLVIRPARQIGTRKHSPFRNAGTASWVGFRPTQPLCPNCAHTLAPSRAFYYHPWFTRSEVSRGTG